MPTIPKPDRNERMLVTVVWRKSERQYVARSRAWPTLSGHGHTPSVALLGLAALVSDAEINALREAER